MADQEEYVVFEDAEGNEISNDPRWKAEQTLKRSGNDTGALKARIKELEAQIATGAVSPGQAMAATEGAPGNEATADDEDEEHDVDDAGNRTYAEVSGKELKTLARDRGVDIAGMTKVGQVREALIAADAGTGSGETGSGSGSTSGSTPVTRAAKRDVGA